MSRELARLAKLEIKQKADALKVQIELQKKAPKISAQNIPILKTTTYSFDSLKPFWKGCDTRKDPTKHIMDFISINKEAFDFIGIVAELDRNNKNEILLKLTTSNYAGCIPLKSPATGMVYGELSVVGIYNENLSELISVINEDIQIEYHDSLEIHDTNVVKPPLYFECQKFIDKYIEAQKNHWQKFKNIERNEHIPTSSTRWEKYSFLSIDPRNTFKYPNRRNVLTIEHTEWLDLTYVLDLSIREILKNSTPARSKAPYLSKISVLSKQYIPSQLRRVDIIHTHQSDPLIIKDLKEMGNRILISNVSCRKAWRIDYAEFFERYVQHILGKVANKKRAVIDNNRKFPIRGKKTAWTLSYLEPDIVIHKGDIQYVIDAKYKSHMFNVMNSTEELKETFRHDLHQVLAYSSFSSLSNKKMMLIYPCGVFVEYPITMNSPITHLTSELRLVGIPLSLSKMAEVEDRLSELISF